MSAHAPPSPSGAALPRARDARPDARPPSLGRTLALGATFAATIAAAVVAWVQVVDRLRNVVPLETRGTPAAIVWSERVFRTEAEFAKWLRGRGISYERWARTHPRAVEILRSRDRVAAARRPAAAPRTAAAPRPAATPRVAARPRPASAPRPDARPRATAQPRPAAREAEVALPAEPKSASGGITVLTVAFLLTASLGLVVVLAAVGRAAWRSSRGLLEPFVRTLGRYRLVVVASAVLLGVGVLVGTLYA